MALIVPTPAFSEVSNGEVATPAIQPPPPSRSWKNKFQKHVYSWKRQNGNGILTKTTSSSTQDTDHDSVDSTARSPRIPSGLRSGRNNTVSSPNHVRPLQSDSLDSLTSASLFSRNSYPSIFSTGTDATSISGVVVSCGVTCPVESQFVKPYKRMKNNLIVYIAHDDIQIPLDVVEQWETSDLDRLKTDLSEVVMEIYRKGVDRESRRRRSALYIPPGPHEYDISFELRMSGRATRDAQQVAIGPAIWLICGSTWACKEISAAMKEITWPMLPVEIHEGRVPVPSVADGQVDIEKLDLTDGYDLGDGITLYIHVEDLSTDTTSCGLLCCATIKDGDTYSHHFSRIGGLVTATNTLKSSQFGVSTAHGMLDHPWWHKELWKRNPTTTWDCQSVESADSQEEDDLGHDSLYDDQEDLYAELPISHDVNQHAYDIGEGYRDPQLVSHWRNVSRHGLLSFLGASMVTESNLRLHNDSGTQTDHAMIQLKWSQDTISRSWNNKYRPRGVKTKGSIDITTHMSNKDLTEGAVSIICQANSPLDGHLLPGSTCLAMSGRLFTLRKLKTEAPLARGVSGSWVARGTELCGMVIAIANLEPYVYMMRAEDLISNLEASSSSIETIEIFNSHNRKVKRGTDRTVPQGWDSRKSQHRLKTAIKPSGVSVDEHSPIATIKRGFGARLRSLSGSALLHDVAKGDLYQKMKPRQKRPIYNLLSNMFSSHIEEIIQSVNRDANDTKRTSEARRPIADNSRTHRYHPLQAKRRPLPGNKRRLRVPLEPISEVSSVIALGVDSAPELEYTFLQSTACAPTISFRHGRIRLHKMDLAPGQEPNANVDEVCPEYDIALSRTAHHWHSSNYESQQEEEIDEIQDLVDWWESWGIEDLGGLITEEEDEPHSPMSTTSDSFPGVSYSDTTSEDSVSSCHVWTDFPDSVAQGCFSKCSFGYELEDIARTPGGELSEGNASGLSLEVLSELTGGADFPANFDEIRGGDCVQGIMA
ncbi:hypothetical protein E0Z10_g10900 [Xylaria hypoxylon]|uniref:Uncharacterized protein n=1 Tax=Xylaria hypoxylon TaxID=37992 RepID=A0A4Z0YBU7_9PEZI|nr:hypothetical protein E0Z10_g10900 [Xylaria hypoxylon]